MTISFLQRAPEQVEGISWEQFLIALRRGSVTPKIRAWNPGDHVALTGPTGEGKTTFAVGILRLRSWVLALDPKGGDATLAKSGFTQILGLPPPGRIQDQIAEGKPARLIVTGSARNEEEDAALHRLMAEALDYARWTGGWTVYADEFQLLGDNRMFKLGPPVERMLIAARQQGTSIVTSFQAMAWVPRAAVRQATAFAALFPTRDREMIKETAQAMGRDWTQVVFIMDRLARHPDAEYMCLFMPRSIRDPMLIVKAAEV